MTMYQDVDQLDPVVEKAKALASAPRLAILDWLKAPADHFGHQQYNDPATVGVCVTLIAEKLGVSQPTASRHLDLLHRAGFVRLRKIERWSFFSRNEEGLAAYKAWLTKNL